VKIPSQFRFKTGASAAACEAASWNNIADGGTFSCSGYVKLRIGSTAAGSVTGGAFYDDGGFNWQDDGGSTGNNYGGY